MFLRPMGFILRSETKIDTTFDVVRHSDWHEVGDLHELNFFQTENQEVMNLSMCWKSFCLIGSNKMIFNTHWNSSLLVFLFEKKVEFM